MIYVASYLEATLIGVPDAFNESIFLMLKSARTTGRLLFGNIYRSPSSTQLKATGKMRICGHADVRIEQRVKCGSECGQKSANYPPARVAY